VSRPCFPPTVLELDPPFPPPGPRGASSPASSVLWRTPTSERPSRRASLSFAPAVPTDAPVFASWPPDAGSRTRSFVSGSPRHMSVGDVRTSQVPGESSCAYAPALDPGRTAAPRRDGAVTRPPDRSTPRAPGELKISRLDPAALALAVYASPRRLPGRDARLASGCRLGSAGWDWLPTGLVRKVSVVRPTSLPPSPGFAWRKPRVSQPAERRTDSRFCRCRTFASSGSHPGVLSAPCSVCGRPSKWQT
jgi:hypothetical protein